MDFIEVTLASCTSVNMFAAPCVAAIVIIWGLHVEVVNVILVLLNCLTVHKTSIGMVLREGNAVEQFKVRHNYSTL